MAMQKAITLQNETTGDWFIVDSIANLIMKSGFVSFNLSLYKDSTTRTNDKPVMGIETITLSGADFPLSNTDQEVAGKNITKLIYEKLISIGSRTFNNVSIDFTGCTEV